MGKIGHAGGKVGAGARVPTEADSVGGGGDDGPGGGDSKDVGGAGGGQGSGGGDDDGDGDKSGDEAGGEIEIAAEGRRREKIVRKVDRAISRGKVSAQYSSGSWQFFFYFLFGSDVNMPAACTCLRRAWILLENCCTYH